MDAGRIGVLIESSAKAGERALVGLGEFGVILLSVAVGVAVWERKSEERGVDSVAVPVGSVVSDEFEPVLA